MSRTASLLIACALALSGCSKPPPDYVTPEEMSQLHRPPEGELLFTVVRDTPFWPTSSTAVPAQGIVHRGTRVAEILEPGEERTAIARVWTENGFVCYIARRDIVKKPRDKDQH